MTWVRANLPTGLHKWLKLRAVKEGVTLTQLVEKLLEEARRKDERR